MTIAFLIGSHDVRPCRMRCLCAARGTRGDRTEVRPRSKRVSRLELSDAREMRRSGAPAVSFETVELGRVFLLEVQREEEVVPHVVLVAQVRFEIEREPLEVLSLDIAHEADVTYRVLHLRARGLGVSLSSTQVGVVDRAAHLRPNHTLLHVAPAHSALASRRTSR